MITLLARLSIHEIDTLCFGVEKLSDLPALEMSRLGDQFGLHLRR